MADGGSYVLGIDVPRGLAIEVGALGELTFPAGTYAYVGSAFGPGGFARVDRHRELARGDRTARHWHVDYLLCTPSTRLASALTFPGEDRECALAGALPGEPVAGFGASDCACESHLLALPAGTTLAEAVAAVGVRGGTDVVGEDGG